MPAHVVGATHHIYVAGGLGGWASGHVGSPEAHGEAPVVSQGGVEGVPDVVHGKGGELHHPVDQEAHRVHQVRLEGRTRDLLIPLQKERTYRMSLVLRRLHWLSARQPRQGPMRENTTHRPRAN